MEAGGSRREWRHKGAHQARPSRAGGRMRKSANRVVIAVVLFACGGRGGEGDNRDMVINPPQRARIGPSGGSLSVGAYRLEVPPGALATEVEIEAKPAGTVCVPTIDLAPNGLAFSVPVEMFVEVMPRCTLAPRQYTIAHAIGDRWVRLPTTRDGNTLSTSLQHFSAYAALPSTTDPVETTGASVSNGPLTIRFPGVRDASLQQVGEVVLLGVRGGVPGDILSVSGLSMDGAWHWRAFGDGQTMPHGTAFVEQGGSFVGPIPFSEYSIIVSPGGGTTDLTGQSGCEQSDQGLGGVWEQETSTCRLLADFSDSVIVYEGIVLDCAGFELRPATQDPSPFGETPMALALLKGAAAKNCRVRTQNIAVLCPVGGQCAVDSCDLQAGLVDVLIGPSLPPTGRAAITNSRLGILGGSGAFAAAIRISGAPRSPMLVPVSAEHNYIDLSNGTGSDTVGVEILAAASQDFDAHDGVVLRGNTVALTDTAPIRAALRLAWEDGPIQGQVVVQQNTFNSVGGPAILLEKKLRATTFMSTWGPEISRNNMATVAGSAAQLLISRGTYEATPGGGIDYLPFPFEASVAGEGNYWGRFASPLFCAAGTPSCVAQSNDAVVRDTHAYCEPDAWNRGLSPGQCAVQPPPPVLIQPDARNVVVGALGSLRGLASGDTVEVLWDNIPWISTPVLQGEFEVTLNPPFGPGHYQWALYARRSAPGGDLYSLPTLVDVRVVAAPVFGPLIDEPAAGLSTPGPFGFIMGRLEPGYSAPLVVDGATVGPCEANEDGSFLCATPPLQPGPHQLALFGAVTEFTSAAPVIVGSSITSRMVEMQGALIGLGSGNISSHVQETVVHLADNVCDGCAGFDADDDGVCDVMDTCPTTPNPEQTDADGDGAGDACDPCPTVQGGYRDRDAQCVPPPTCANGDAPVCSRCRPTFIRARREHHPDRRVRGHHCSCRPQSVRIPCDLPVSEGNAGNHSGHVEFTEADGSRFSCHYRGGGDHPHARDDDERRRGRRYEFDHCDNGLHCGQVIHAGEIEVDVEDGDSSAGDTEVEVRFDDEDDECGCQQDGHPVDLRVLLEESFVDRRTGLEFASQVTTTPLMLRPDQTVQTRTTFDGRDANLVGPLQNLLLDRFVRVSVQATFDDGLEGNGALPLLQVSTIESTGRTWLNSEGVLVKPSAMPDTKTCDSDWGAALSRFQLPTSLSRAIPDIEFCCPAVPSPDEQWWFTLSGTGAGSSTFATWFGSEGGCSIGERVAGPPLCRKDHPWSPYGEVCVQRVATKSTSAVCRASGLALVPLGADEFDEALLPPPGQYALEVLRRLRGIPAALSDASAPYQFELGAFPSGVDADGDGFGNRFDLCLTVPEAFARGSMCGAAVPAERCVRRHSPDSDGDCRGDACDTGLDESGCFVDEDCQQQVNPCKDVGTCASDGTCAFAQVLPPEPFCNGDIPFTWTCEAPNGRPLWDCIEQPRCAASGPCRTSACVDGIAGCVVSSLPNGTACAVAGSTSRCSGADRLSSVCLEGICVATTTPCPTGTACNSQTGVCE